jgi:carboxylesterase
MKKRVILSLVLTLIILSGCGELDGMKSRAMLAREDALHPRDLNTGLLPNAGPISLPGNGNEKAALLIHGFGDTPYDLKPLAIALYKEGIAVYAPLLPGHGTSVRDFARSGKKDWIAASDKAFDELSRRYRKVYVVGFSMGGDITLDIAAKKKPAAVVLLAPCVFINGQSRFITPEYTVKNLSRFLFTDYVITHPSFSFDKKAIEGRPVYDLFPIKALRELVSLEESVRRELPEVKEPLLVIQSKNDPTVDISGPDYIMNHVSSRDKGVFWVERSGHLLCLDAEKERVIKKVSEFILEHQTCE